MLSTRINPFKPSAGHLPPVLIGRDMVLADFEEGLDNGSGAPGRLMRITGARGVGKTVMLAEFRRIAEKRGWQTISETASDGNGCAVLVIPSGDSPNMIADKLNHERIACSCLCSDPQGFPF